jgi:hypothetical protein
MLDFLLLRKSLFYNTITYSDIDYSKIFDFIGPNPFIFINRILITICF